MKTTKPRQASMFEDGQDLPLFTGQGVTVTLRQADPEPAGKQSAMALFETIRPIIFFHYEGVEGLLEGQTRTEPAGTQVAILRRGVDRVLLVTEDGWLAYAHSTDFE